MELLAFGAGVAFTGLFVHGGGYRTGDLNLQRLGVTLTTCGSIITIIAFYT